MSYTFKTYGREYDFSLEDDGLLHCKDLGLQHENLEGLKTLVTNQVKTEKALPRIPVIFIGGRWDVVTEYSLASASAKMDRHGYRWVSYKYKGKWDKAEKTKRQLMGSDRLFLDTEQNREFMEQAVQIGHDIEMLTAVQKQVLSKMSKIGQEAEEE